ncbi:MAG: right-handed parallel beta-helix repeat-containing protein, partial [Thermoplasmata archaeon]|nr:right-handed parallel beta-helix repeat-containing protein [Thermoplasmata archaeon]
MKKASIQATTTTVILITAVFLGFGISDDGSVFAEGSGDYPPPLTGDWIIGNATVVSNETLLVSGNVTILPGGSLILSNATLLINCSQNGTFHIEVASFGTLSLLDDSNITSAIENGTHNYEFWVDPDASLTVSNSSIGYVGWNGAGYEKMGISIQSNNVSISDSWIHHGFLGILLYNASGPVFMTNNTFTDILHDALYAEATEVVLRGNTVFDCGSGFVLGFANGGIVESNTFLSNGYGIYLGQSENITVERNTLTSNRWEGIILIGSTSNSISRNEVAGNQDGIILWQSNLNVIEDNIVANNSNGLWIWASSQNRMFHNRILWNTVQAYDDDVNTWDDGYPSGGNYWSDYLGNDVYSGENQNLPGRDGIGDTPYFLDMNTMDRYPLLVDNRSLFPQPPENITASLEGKEHENVTVSWDLSRDETYGSIVGYDVYRGTLYVPSGIDYTLVDSLANGSSSWTDIGSGEGDANDYFYVVCALSNTSLSSCTSDQAAKFTRTLASGPNLVSVPLIQSNESIETVLQTVEYDKAW